MSIQYPNNSLQVPSLSKNTFLPLERELTLSPEIKTTKATAEIFQKVIQQEEPQAIDEDHNVSSILRENLRLVTTQSTQKEDLLEKSATIQDIQEDDLFLVETSISEHDILDKLESEALQEDTSSVAKETEALKEHTEASQVNILSVAEKVQEVAEKTLSIKEENQALTKNTASLEENTASLEEKIAARNLNHSGLQNLNNVQSNNQTIQADVSKLKKAAQLVRAGIDENNSVAMTRGPSDTTSKGVTDINQQFIALNLSKMDIEKTETIINTVILNAKSTVETKKLGIYETPARKKAEWIIKEDAVKYGNANFTKERLENIGNKFLEECRDSGLIFKKNPDGTPNPTPLTNDEFEDLKNTFKNSFIASLANQGLIKGNEIEQKEDKETDISVVEGKYSVETRISTFYSFKNLSITKNLIPGFPKMNLLRRSLMIMQSRTYEKAKAEEREQRFILLTEKIIQREIHRGIIKEENLKHDILITDHLAQYLWFERIKTYRLAR